jgi:hypothetical protein
MRARSIGIDRPPADASAFGTDALTLVAGRAAYS